MIKGENLMAKLYIFGAGLTCEIGYPLVYNMYNKLISFCNKSKQTHLANNPPKYSDEIEIIQKYFEKWKNKKKYHFEEFISDIMETKKRKQLADDGINPQFIDNFFNLPYMLYDYFWHINNHSKRHKFKKSLKNFILNNVKPGDVIIDFNYDMEIEKLLESNRKWWDYKFGKTKISLIKIHGSIKWLKTKPNDVLTWHEEDGSVSKENIKDKYKKLIGNIYYSIHFDKYFDYLWKKSDWKIAALPIIVPPAEDNKYISKSGYERLFKYLIN